MPLREQAAAPEMVQEAFAYEPDSVPSLQVRVSCVHVCPKGTEDDWYAVTDFPSGTVRLSHVQERDCGGGVVVTAQDAY